MFFRTPQISDLLSSDFWLTASIYLRGKKVHSKDSLTLNTDSSDPSQKKTKPVPTFDAEHDGATDNFVGPLLTILANLSHMVANLFSPLWGPYNISQSKLLM